MDVAIEDLNHAQKVSSIAPTKGAFGTVNVLLTDIRVRSLLINGDLLQIYA